MYPIKIPARVASTGNVTLAGGAPNTVDGVALVVGNRILVHLQTAPAENGVYVVSTLGSGANGTWIRANDANSSAEMFDGVLVEVCEGTLGADSLWRLVTNNPITLGVSQLVFRHQQGQHSRSVTAAGVDTITTFDDVVIYNATLGNQTPTLPDITLDRVRGSFVYVKRSAADASANTVTITPQGGQTIDNAGSRALLASQSAFVYAPLAGTNWEVL